MTDPAPGPRGRTDLARVGAALLLALLVAPFAYHSADFGWESLSGGPVRDSYLFAGHARLAEAGLSLHMLAGAAITLVVPFQVLPVLRRRLPWLPWLHRWTGRIVVAASLAASAGGLSYIALEGTIGGGIMNAGFALYGLLLGTAAILAIRAARRGEYGAHRNWALRLAVLILGSWLFRVHYGIWFAATGGAGSTETLTGPFDRIQVFAFYLPYLAMLEFYLWRSRTATA